MTAGRKMTTGSGKAAEPSGASASPQRLLARLGGMLRRLNAQLTSLNARMEGESVCRRCGICHHVCGMLATSRHGNGLPKE